jgi:hypothetical protein
VSRSRWLFRVAFLPSAVFLGTWAVYLGWLLAWRRQDDLDWGLAASWAQVATGFSFAGAGIMALVGIAEQLRPKRPSFSVSTLDWRPSGEPPLVRRGFSIQNRGDAEATTVQARLMLWGLKSEGEAALLMFDGELWRSRGSRRLRRGDTVRPVLDKIDAKLVPLRPKFGGVGATLRLRAPLQPGGEVIVGEVLVRGFGSSLSCDVTAANLAGRAEAKISTDFAEALFDQEKTLSGGPL